LDIAYLAVARSRSLLEPVAEDPLSRPGSNLALLSKKSEPQDIRFAIIFGVLGAALILMGGICYR
jgi:hypothetical protein